MRAARGQPTMLLLFTDVFANGGIQRFNRTFLRALNILGARFDVLSMNDTPKSIDGFPSSADARIVGFSGDRTRFSLATLRAIWRRQYDWIVIGHINLLSMTIATLATRPFSRPRTILIAHGIEVWYGVSHARRHALAKVDSVLCVSNYTRRRLLEQVAKLLPERLQVFPNALSDTWTGSIRPPVALETRKRFILSVTRLEKGDRYKGIVTVIEALSMLADRSLEYVVVGQGKDMAFLQWVAARSGVGSRVHFLSGIGDQELIVLYEKCEAFVLPSGKEGFGIVFLEAMFFGAPVIAAAEKGALDVVHDEENGLLVRFGDSMAVGRAIERLLDDRELRERLRRNGRATVTDGGAFTFSRFVERSGMVLGIPGALAE
jgi:glycosyltransferase involved in cell wall biosynthesis